MNTQPATHRTLFPTTIIRTRGAKSCLWIVAAVAWTFLQFCAVPRGGLRSEPTSVVQWENRRRTGIAMPWTLLQDCCCGCSGMDVSQFCAVPRGGLRSEPISVGQWQTRRTGTAVLWILSQECCGGSSGEDVPAMLCSSNRWAKI